MARQLCFASPVQVQARAFESAFVRCKPGEFYGGLQVLPPLAVILTTNLSKCTVTGIVSLDEIPAASVPCIERSKLWLCNRYDKTFDGQGRKQA